MHIIQEVFGVGKDLSAFQMTCRALVIFFIALILIRISGRRSFGLHTPLDNIVTITLGAVLSRAIVGASDFLAVVIASTVMVLLHRGLSWCMMRNKGLSRLVCGEQILLFSKDRFHQDNMNKALVSREDIMEGVRKSALLQDLGKVDQIYLERNGEISVVKKP